MNLKDSKTQQNLMTAYLRECGAYNEYTFYAEQAKQEGYEDIYRIYKEFAENEKAHAKVWFKYFHGIGNTEENLKDASDLERYERSVMYNDFANVARIEGFIDIAEKFEIVASIEGFHEQKYKEYLDKVKNDKMFSSETEVTWKCLNCGHIHKGKTPPTICPSCSHPISFFKQLPEQ